MLLHAVQTLSHLDWIILRAVQKQVRNPKHGRPPVPAAQIAAEASESYWMLNAAAAEEESDIWALHLRARNTDRMHQQHPTETPNEWTISQEQKHPDLSDNSHYDPSLCFVIYPPALSSRIVLCREILGKQKVQQRREKEKNADLTLQISNRARLQITASRTVWGNTETDQTDSNLNRAVVHHHGAT